MFDSGAPERDAVLRRAGVAGVAAHLASLLSSFVVVAIAVRHVGTERYGLWVTAIAAAGFLGVADAGVGNGLVNLLSPLDPRRDKSRIQVIVSSAVAVVGAGGLVAAVMVVAVYVVSPTALFGLPQERADEVEAAILITGACFTAMLLVGLLPKIHLGLREGWWGSIWSGIGSLLALGAVAGAAMAGADFPVMLLCAVGAPVAALAVGWIFLALRHPECRPTRSAVRAGACRQLMGRGIGYLVIQVATIVGFQTDSIVIAAVIGADAVPLYAVPMKLFAIAPGFVSMLLVSLWPVYAEAIASNDTGWVGRAFWRSVGVAAGINVPTALALLALGGAVVESWTGGLVRPGFDVLLPLAVWLVLNSLGGPLALLLNGIGMVRFQAVAACLMAPVNLVLSVALVRRLGVGGAVWGTNLSLLLVVYLPSIITLRRRSRTAPVEPPPTGVALGATVASPAASSIP